MEKKNEPRVTVHPNADVAPTAELGVGVEIGAGAVIGPKVKLGDRVRVATGAIIEGRTTIGAGSQIYPFATIGMPPQDLKYAGEDTHLIIGESNHIREYVNISLGTQGGGGCTEIGDNNLIMVYTHIAHDCKIGNYCIFANQVQLAGHITVQNNVVFGGMSGGHQFCNFGEYAMIAAGSIVVQDVTPYCMVQGDRAKVSGLNLVGLRRAGIREEKLSQIKNMFKILYKQNLTFDDATSKISRVIPDSPYKEAFLRFLEQSKRGVCR